MLGNRAAKTTESRLPRKAKRRKKDCGLRRPVVLQQHPLGESSSYKKAQDRISVAVSRASSDSGGCRAHFQVSSAMPSIGVSIRGRQILGFPRGDQFVCQDSHDGT